MPVKFDSEFAMTIDGELVFSEKKIPVLNPATEEVVAHAPDCGAAQLDAAVRGARQAFNEWRSTSIEIRRKLLEQLATAILDHLDPLSKILTLEQGKALEASKAELLGSVDWIRKTASLELPQDVRQDSGSSAAIRHLPLGVVAGIPPWNYPVNLSAMKIAPALLTGNTLVLKPSPFTPLSMLKIGELARDIFPRGVFSVISGGDELGPLMTAHPGFDKISFTGSTATGRSVMRSAAPTLKRLTLELGGNDPAIVLPGVDVPAVAQTLFWCAFTNSGQICLATKRIYVHEDIYDTFMNVMVETAKAVKVGNGLAPETQLGPISNRPQFERVKALIKDSIDNGHEILAGGLPEQKNGYFIPITIVGNPPENSRIVQEEQFGPIIPVMKFTDVEDAIKRANALDVGLGAMVWGGDHDQAIAVGKRLEAGTVWVNQPPQLAASIPFGGFKQSGIGSEGGVEGLLAYTVTQSLWSKI